MKDTPKKEVSFVIWPMEATIIIAWVDCRR